MTNATDTSPLLTPDDLASAIAQRLVANLPGADSLAQILQRTISAIFQGAISQPGAPVDSLDSLLAPLIKYGGQLVGSPILSTSAPSALAQSIAALLDPYLRAPFAIAPMPDPNKFPQLMKAALESQENLKADFAALAKQEPFKTIIGVFKDSGLIDWANQSLDPTTLAVLYTPDKVAKVLRAIVKSLIQIYGKLLQPLVNYVEAELAASTARSAIAAAIGKALNSLPFSVKSDLAIGSKVHRVLQESYTLQHRLLNDIVIERFNPYAGKAELVVIGPTTAMPGVSGLQFRAVPLEQLAVDPLRDPVLAFKTLRMAMNGFKFYEDSWLRADLVDFEYDMIWEIKPSSNLSGGVWQETMYRVTYNVLRLLFGTVFPQVKAVPKFLSAGTYWSEADAKTFSFGLTGAQLLSNIPVGDAVAVPFQVAALPGLIGYFVLRKPWAELLVLVLAALQDAIKKALDEAKKLAKGLGKALDEIETALKAFLDALSRWIGVIIVVAAVLAAAILAGGAAVATAGAIIIIIVVAGSKSGSGSGGKDGSTTTTEIDIAGVRVSGVPVDQVPDFLAEVAKQIQRISAAASKFAAA